MESVSTGLQPWFLINTDTFAGVLMPPPPPALTGINVSSPRSTLTKALLALRMQAGGCSAHLLMLNGKTLLEAQIGRRKKEECIQRNAGLLRKIKMKFPDYWLAHEGACSVCAHAHACQCVCGE